MIPWLIVHLVSAIVELFGFQIYVRATSGNWWGAGRIYFVRTPPDSQRLRRPKVHRPGHAAHRRR